MFNRTLNRVLVTILTILGIHVPCILLNYFYIRIFLSTVQTRRRAQRHNQLENKKAKIDYKFSIGLFASLSLFTFTLMPYSVILIVDYADNLNRIFHAYGLVLMRINSCLNPVLYLNNPMFKKGYKNAYNFIFNRKEYSFSIVKKEKKLLNKRLILNKIKMNRQIESVNDITVYNDEKK